jgi:hypothetical protein
MELLVKIGLAATILKETVLVKLNCWGSYLTPTYNNAPIPVMPRRALAVLSGIARLGVRQGCRTLLEGQESLPANPDKTDRAQEASGIGRISFGYFSLSAQRKVSRPPVREPVLE